MCFVKPSMEFMPYRGRALYQSHAPNHTACSERYQCIDGDTVKHGAKSRLFKIEDARREADRRRRGHHQKLAHALHIARRHRRDPADAVQDRNPKQKEQAFFVFNSL